VRSSKSAKVVSEGMGERSVVIIGSSSFREKMLIWVPANIDDGVDVTGGEERPDG
jgi:hypothetical protein